MRHCNRCKHRPFLNGFATLYAIGTMTFGAAALIYAFARTVGVL